MHYQQRLALSQRKRLLQLKRADPATKRNRSRSGANRVPQSLQSRRGLLADCADRHTRKNLVNRRHHASSVTRTARCSPLTSNSAQPITRVLTTSGTSAPLAFTDPITNPAASLNRSLTVNPATLRSTLSVHGSIPDCSQSLSGITCTTSVVTAAVPPMVISVPEIP